MDSLFFFNNLSGIIIDAAHNAQDWNSPDPCLKGVHSFKFFCGSKPILMFAPPIPNDRKRIMHRILGLRGTSLEVKEPKSARRDNIRLLVTTAKPGYFHRDRWTDFLLNQEVHWREIPKTVIHMANSKDVCAMAYYIRLKLRRNKSEDVVMVYMGDCDKKWGILNQFRTGECRVLICAGSDIDGMGLETPDIERVIQGSLSEEDTLTNIWQRFERCFPNPEKTCLALLLAEKRDILHPFRKPGTSDCSDGRSGYHLPVSDSHHEDTQRVLNLIQHERLQIPPRQAFETFQIDLEEDDYHSDESLYDLENNMETPPPRELDPALMWLINTTGCRLRCILINLDDTNDYSSLSCLCDNCSFPTREPHNIFHPPPNIEKDDSLQLLRTKAVQSFNQIASELVQGFPLSKTLRFLDTCAYAAKISDAMEHSKTPPELEADLLHRREEFRNIALILLGASDNIEFHI
jgi:hypothetical protein